MITIQYLEDSPELPHLSIDAAVERLRRAAQRVQLSHLLIGWHLPPRLLDACRAEAERLGIRFLHWHPLLTGDATHQPPTDWQVVGLLGKRVPGFRGLAEFTFACPNHPDAQESISRRLEALIRTGMYQGFFLDRIRFPSPAADPLNNLGCFCEHCRKKAAGLGVDLEAVRRALVLLAHDTDGIMRMALALLEAQPSLPDHPTGALMKDLLDSRACSVTDLTAVIAAQLRGAGLEVGLDCFSPGLAKMVGQDLAALSGHVDWIKIMSYAHTLGPAGLPFELRDMCDFLRSATGLKRAEILQRMAEALDRPLPKRRKALEESGLSPLALQQEVEAGVKISRVPILAGIELVSIAGVTHLSNAQIRADLLAVKAAGPGGLSISWDLQHIPWHRLDLVRENYVEN
jgi:hypothetical protein